jgi:hypothetical protein
MRRAIKSEKGKRKKEKGKRARLGNAPPLPFWHPYGHFAF